MIKELKDVVDDWKIFGVSLGVPVRKLDGIELADPRRGVENWKLKMFQFWLQYKPDASWNDVIRALKANEYNDLAATLSRNYLLAADSGGTQGIYVYNSSLCIIVHVDNHDHFEHTIVFQSMTSISS